MNVDQRIAFEKLQAEVGHHVERIHDSILHVTIHCSCGFQYVVRRKQNALARNAKLYGGLRKHLLEQRKP